MNASPIDHPSMTEHLDQLVRPTVHLHIHVPSRSSAMYSLHEALARDRMRESEQRSAEARLMRSLSASRRWHRVAVRAGAASERHAVRASQVATAR